MLTPRGRSSNGSICEWGGGGPRPLRVKVVQLPGLADGEDVADWIPRVVGDQVGKDSMEPARHHDADLTFGRCAHTRLEDLSKVVDRLPDLRVSHTLPTSAVSEGPNGTPRTIGSPVQNGPRWPHQDIQIGFSAWSRKGLNDDLELITAKD